MEETAFELPQERLKYLRDKFATLMPTPLRWQRAAEPTEISRPLSEARTIAYPTQIRGQSISTPADPPSVRAVDRNVFETSLLVRHTRIGAKTGGKSMAGSHTPQVHLVARTTEQ